MKNFFILLCLLLFWRLTYSQEPVCHAARTPEGIKLTERAKRYIDQYPQKALKDLLAAVQLESSNAEANYLIGTLYEAEYERLLLDNVSETVLAKQRTEVERYYKRALKFCPGYDNYMGYYRFGVYYFKQKARITALSYLREYLKHGSGEELELAKGYVKAIEVYNYLVGNPVPFAPKAIKQACTTDDEYLPLVSPDGRYLFFTRRARRKIQAGKLFLDEVFMFSERSAGTDFGAGKLMPEPFNDGRNQGGATITIDNKTMFVTICTNVFFGQSAYKNCDLYETNFVNGKWTEPINLGDKVNGRNSFEAQPTVSADGNTLFFVSIREGSLGKMDIYKTSRDKYGKWGLAQNLGPTINTAEDDKTPFLHADGKTLYFASKGHLGVGGFDIFFSKLNGGKWGEPKNIGYPINTEADDLGLILTADAEQMYFASRNLSNDEQFDLFTAELPMAARPEPVLFVKGSITNTENEQLAEASVALENLKTKVVTAGSVDRKTGEYAVAVPVRKTDDYVMTVDKKGHIFRSKYIDPNEPEFDSIAVVDFKMPVVKKGVKVQLENIYFEFNSSAFNYKSRVSLANFRTFLVKNPTISVGIYGHTDNVGDDAYNLKLSDDRAKAVYDYLVKQGIAAARLSYKGFGESAPIETNETDEGRAKNRRTEFVIL